MSYQLSLQKILSAYQYEPEYIQAVTEVMESLKSFVNKHPKYLNNSLLEQLTQSERILQFRAPWRQDDGSVQVNTGYRMQF